MAHCIKINLITCFLICFYAAQQMVSSAEIVSQSQLVAKKNKLDAAFKKELAKLATWCDSQQLVQQAKSTRSWLINPEVGKLYYVYAAKKIRVKDVGDRSTTAEKAFQQRFLKLRTAQAQSLYQLAKTSAKADPSFSVTLLYAALRENPDHQIVRKILGDQQYQGNWYSTWGLRQVKAKKVWHDQFGWIAADDVKQYEQGQRRYGKKWITAAADAKRHRLIRSGWKIQTAHFLITTNHSLERGAQLANQLERFYEIWKQAFVGFYLTPTELQKRFAQEKSIDLKKKFRVVYFRNKQEYVQTLRSIQPNVAISIGVYLDKPKTSYFYAGKDQHPATIFHEATHQLFKESRKGAKTPGKKRHFWVVEGIACFMETYHDRGEFATLGGKDKGRMPAARERLLVDQFYIPFGELTQFGATDLQRHRRIASIYSQVAGQTDFLMNDQQGKKQDGKMRTALIKYLQAIYSNKAKSNQLEKLTGYSHAELDKLYLTYLRRQQK